MIRTLRITSYVHGSFLFPALLLAACARPAAALDTPPGPAQPASPSITITQKDIEGVITPELREAAIRRLIRRLVVDARAKEAGLTVTDADAQAAVDQWKTQKFGGSDLALQGELARQGLTLSDYREVVREGMIADQIVAKPTVLTDADYDQMLVDVFRFHSLQDATQAATAIGQGTDLPSVVRQFNGQSAPPTPVLVYDQRFDRQVLEMLFRTPIGGFAGPIPTHENSDYLMLKVRSQIHGHGMSGLDRQVYSNYLLQTKIKYALQDWWTGVEKQVTLVYNGLTPGTAAPAPPSGGPPPAAGAPVVGPSTIPGPAGDKQNIIAPIKSDP